ncbi:MAG: carbonic anhydrase [Armatimonadetes bacterium]|nr:carbonic anhydrase [Armatimonadota bacterium]
MVETEDQGRVTTATALTRLKEGNARFAAGTPAHPRQDQARRAAVLGEPLPFAAVVSCSDSRVPTEIVFDQGIGDVFCVRTAGHVVDGAATGSLELAVTLWRVPLVVVLGHTGCGAIQATLEHVRSPGQLPGSVSAVVWAISDVARQAAASLTDDPLGLAVELNTRATVARLSESRPILSDATASGALAVVGAVYDLRTGVVRWLESAAPTPRAGAV